jgi:hypothetical protein
MYNSSAKMYGTSLGLGSNDKTVRMYVLRFGRLEETLKAGEQAVTHTHTHTHTHTTMVGVCKTHPKIPFPV